MNELESRKGFGPVGVITAFLGGAAAGTVAALLLAPRSGEETRKAIGDAVAKQKEKVSRLGIAAREAKEAFTEAISESH